MLLNGSDVIIECLLEQGVDTIFGYPGGAVLNIYDAIYKYSDKIRHIITAHEQGACHAADGYARTTGKTGVVLATSGPGATNLVTGIATAYMDSIPMVAITGNVTRNLLGLDSFQEVDICGITMPITKHNYIVKDPAKLPEIIREAFYIANEGRKGPVLIDIPKDITAAMIEYDKCEPKPIVNHNPDGINEEIAAAAELIKNAERPFIYAGGGVVSADATEEMAEFVKKVDAPVSLSLMGQCAVDNTIDNYIGMLGMHGTKTAALALSKCDLMIVLGSRFSDRVLCNPNTFAKNTKIIHIEIDPAEIGKNIEVYHHVTGDVKYILSRLNELLPDLKHKIWMDQVMQWKKDYALRMVPIESEDEVLPQDVIEELDRLTEGSAIITTEVGQHQMWAAQYYNFRKPRSFASSGGLGTMGYGFGAAMGSKVGNPDRTVVNIAGDGSFFMNCNELSSLAKHKIPMIELVFENDVLGMVRQWQRLFYGKRFSQTNIERGTDLMKLADAFGVEGVRITKKSDIKPMLEKALSCGKPCLVDVIINKDINVLPMVPAGKDVSEPIMSIDLND
ncbi:biosynthetic-type acetolactate synthase large subunit [uncultured Ruminococcus sp.]|uniref:biosynthetic-type acetolactate synthase large subunit n=1 Tax=uncultured Ruminococcus sp. TaxID=165186 RepID=UPI0025FD9430|nr:biosynthetic-type acetolactate synthase large subunit [uncultured Ruminococcus sp.]